MSIQSLIEGGLGMEYQAIALVLSVFLSLVFFASDFRIGLIGLLVIQSVAFVVLTGIGVPYIVILMGIGVNIVLLAISVYTHHGQRGFL